LGKFLIFGTGGGGGAIICIVGGAGGGGGAIFFACEKETSDTETQIVTKVVLRSFIIFFLL
jgi:hypothetical protein